jgi:hypothetical protein
VSEDESSRVKLVDSCVEITAAQREDRGTYTVTAENCFGPAVMELRLRILMKPSVSIDFQHVSGHVAFDPEEERVTCQVGSQLVVPYKLHGSPKPEVEWYLSNKPVPPSKFNGSRLTLPAVSEVDFGIYKLVAKNELGKAESSFTLSNKSSEPTVTIATTTDSAITETEDIGDVSCDDSSGISNRNCDGNDAWPWWILFVIVGGSVVVLVVLIVSITCMYSCCRSRKGERPTPAKNIENGDVERANFSQNASAL